jgi:uncharacterized protein YjlB
MPAPKPLALLFADDGSIPNNPTLPLLFYRAAFDLIGTPDPEQRIEKILASHGWGKMWRNGIYPYPHYHPTVHEVMGIARGRARVRFGGANGKELDLAPGDAVLLPAGTGHQCLSASPDLVVIGAYPPQGRYKLCRGGSREHERALASIPQVPLPANDPVYGKDGPLKRLWRG